MKENPNKSVLKNLSYFLDGIDLTLAGDCFSESNKIGDDYFYDVKKDKFYCGSKEAKCTRELANRFVQSYKDEVRKQIIENLLNERISSFYVVDNSHDR